MKFQSLLSLPLLASCYLATLSGQVKATSALDNDNVLHQRGLLQMMGGGGEREEKDYDYLIPYHGWMMATAFGLIFPLGVLMPIVFKGTRYWPAAFIVHLGLQILGALFIIAGLALGAKLEVGEAQQHIHRAIGIAVFTLVWLQVLLSIALRPVLHYRAKGLFNVLHWWVGRTALVVGVGNAYYGLKISHPDTRYWVGFSVAIGGVLLLAVFGQLFVHARYDYDYKGRVVLTPADEKSTLKNTYQHITASPIRPQA